MTIDRQFSRQKPDRVLSFEAAEEFRFVDEVAQQALQPVPAASGRFHEVRQGIARSSACRSQPSE